MMANRRTKIFEAVVAAALGVAVAGCSSIYPLDGVARRAEDPYKLQQDVTIDTFDRDSANFKQMAWAAYSVTFRCKKDCPYTVEERKALAAEIAERSFSAFDREIRTAFGSNHQILETAEVVKSAAFARELKTYSFKSTVARWMKRFGLSSSPDVTATAQNLKTVDPSELGWSGGKSLAELGKSLGVEGLLVAHIWVTPSEDAKEPKRLVINGPKIWLFSTQSAQAVAVAGLKPTWRLDPVEPTLEDEATTAAKTATAQPLSTAALTQPEKLSAAKELQELRLDWNGIDAVANGFSTRIAKVLQE